MSVSTLQVHDWGQQARTDAVRWAETLSCRKLSKAEIDAYRAGHENGWRDAVKVLTVQGALKITA